MLFFFAASSSFVRLESGRFLFAFFFIRCLASYFRFTIFCCLLNFLVSFPLVSFFFRSLVVQRQRHINLIVPWFIATAVSRPYWFIYSMANKHALVEGGVLQRAEIQSSRKRTDIGRNQIQKRQQYWFNRNAKGTNIYTRRLRKKEKKLSVRKSLHSIAGPIANR